MEVDKNDQFERLEILIKLTAIGLVAGRRQRQQVKLLTLAGMGPTEISKLLGTTPNTVNVVLSSLRSKSLMNLKEGDIDGE